MGLLTASWLADGILLLVCFIVTFYFYMIRNFGYWKKRGFIELTPVPIIGNILEALTFQKSAIVILQDMYNQGKGHPCVGFYIFDKPFLLIRDPELVKHILVKDSQIFPDRHITPDSERDPIGSVNMFSIKNPAWKVIRSKLTPIFSTGKLKRMCDMMVEVSTEMDRHLESSILNGTGNEMEMKYLSRGYTVDTYLRTFCSLKTNTLDDPNSVFRMCGDRMISTHWFRVYELLTVFADIRLVRILGSTFFGKMPTRFLSRFLTDVMNRRIKSGEKGQDLIDLLIELKNKHEHEGAVNGFEFSGANLIAQGVLFFLGAVETTSSTLAFTLFEIAMNPVVQKTLREEVLKALKESNGEITYDMVMSLPYLDMVVSEALRKYPVLSILDRRAAADYKIPNFDLVIEKGQPVYCSILGLHYDPQYYPDPEIFDPERFSEENRRCRPKHAYVPLGDGPHACIGLRYGFMQVKVAVIRILQKYELMPCEKSIYPVVFHPRGNTVTALGGLYLRVRKVTAAAS